MKGRKTNGYRIPISNSTANLKKYYTFYTGGFVAFVIIVGILEQLGVPNKILGYMFLFATILLYAGIGFMSKTADVSEYYVAGRRVPALFNGMATGADWMSAASFIGMAGTLYATGYDGLAFVMGWTGGYCLVALFLAPYLRKFGQFTIPDFLGARYGGNIPRTIGVFAAVLCSFTYVIAQIYGVGLITSPLHRPRVRHRRVRRPGRHPGLLLPRRHEGGDLDPGGPVHHPDRRLHDPGGLAVGEAHRQPDSADRRLYLGPAQGDGAGEGVQRQDDAQGGGRGIGARDLPREGRGRRCQAEGPGSRRCRLSWPKRRRSWKTRWRP